MQMKILYFAQLKEAAGADEETLVVQGPTTVGEVVRKILDRPLFEKIRGLPLRYALNDEFVSLEQPIEEQAVIAILPPVAGG